MTHSVITELLQWCCSRDIWIHPGLQVTEIRSEEGERLGYLGVRSSQPIDPCTTVVRIPKKCIFSLRSCTLSNELIKICMGEFQQAMAEPNIAVSVALLSELKIGPHSHWWGYLQSLPKAVNIASLWHLTGGADGQLATQWLQGTEVERVKKAAPLEDRLRRFYRSLAEPLLFSSGLSAAFDDMVHAYALVSSRAFHVDAYHGIAMVPIADAFNHVEDNDVHLESDYFVCAVCGSLYECPHDDSRGEGNPKLPDSAERAATQSEDDICEMVSNAQIQPNREVFNTYDSQLSNAHLLCHYGFLLQGNTNDVVSWDGITGIEASLGPPSCPNPHRSALFNYLTHVQPCPTTELLFIPADQTSETSEATRGVPRADFLAGSKQGSRKDIPGGADGDTSRGQGNQRRPDVFCINADGALSFEFYCYLFAHAVDPVFCVARGTGGVGEEINTLDTAEVNLMWSAMTSFLEGSAMTSEELVAVGLLVSDISTCLGILCDKKVNSMYNPGGPDKLACSIAELGDILDSTLSSQPLTRMAIEHVISERSIIEGCKENWKDLVRRAAERDMGETGDFSGEENIEYRCMEAS